MIIIIIIIVHFRLARSRSDETERNIRRTSPASKQNIRLDFKFEITAIDYASRFRDCLGLKLAKLVGKTFG